MAKPEGKRVLNEAWTASVEDAKQLAKDLDMKVVAVEPDNLESALLKAQSAIDHVVKESRNEFANFNYASSDAVVAQCRKALHDAGLVARRESYVVDQNMVSQIFVVSHPKSGERLENRSMVPIVEAKGRPADKALFGALTSSLNYWLRDLLLLPRFDEAEVERRNDNGHEPNGHKFIGSAQQIMQVKAWAAASGFDLSQALPNDLLNRFGSMGMAQIREKFEGAARK